MKIFVTKNIYCLKIMMDNVRNHEYIKMIGEKISRERIVRLSIRIIVQHQLQTRRRHLLLV